MAAITPAQRDAGPIEKECRIFTGYLIGQVPNPYVVDRYVQACQRYGLGEDLDLPCLEHVTLKLARSGGLLARSADAYCALFDPRGVLRRKLVLLTAILEHVAPTSESFDRVEPRGPGRTFVNLVGYGAISVFSLLLGLAILLPMHMLCWVQERMAVFQSAWDKR